MQAKATRAAIAAEPGLYSATPAFVREHGGPIANGILDRVPSWYFAKAKALGLFPNIDIRVHTDLTPGDFPAYPGWHCDGEYRETHFAQPDLDRIPVHLHLVATTSTSSGGVSNASFLRDPFTSTVLRPDSEHTLW